MSNIFSGKLILSDLDNTFLGKGSRVVPENKKAIKYFTANGGKFTFATGRADDLYKIVPDLEDLVNAPVLFCNGAQIYDILAKKSLLDRTFDGKTGDSILGYVKKKYSGVICRCTCERNLFFYDEGDYSSIVEKRWQKIVFISEPCILEEIRIDMTQRFGDIFEIYKSCDTLLEMLVKGATKGAALSEYYKIYPGIKIYAVGDYENDLEMLMAADKAACPSNALDVVKEKCDIVLCGHDEGTVSDLIEKIENGF